ncbi:MAG: hypothetical protein Q7S99_15875 [Parvibaculum sp.]|nr:hypothetical protein [Parvibaculum sp.]|tara:strand:- start:5483 stop:5695 length:213 start_codon:yes stop_codon:yes gene_type:complete
MSRDSANEFQCAKVGFVIPEYMVCHMKQENEADRFAVELLAPEARMVAFLKQAPDLEQSRATGHSCEERQ